MDKPKRGVKNVTKKCNPICPYLTQSWVKTTQHFVECEVCVFGGERLRLQERIFAIIL